MWSKSDYREEQQVVGIIRVKMFAPRDVTQAVHVCVRVCSVDCGAEPVSWILSIGVVFFYHYISLNDNGGLFM